MFDQLSGEPNIDLRMALEMKHTKDFFNKHSQSEAAVFSRSRITHLSCFKTRQFQKSRFFEYGIVRADGSAMTITSADFHRMNPAEILDLAYICRHRSETKLEVKYHHLALREFISSIIHDFGYEDADLHSEFINTAPPLQEPNTYLDGVGDISRGYSTAPVRAMIFEEEPEEGRSPSLLCFRLEEKHLYPTDLFTVSLNPLKMMNIWMLLSRIPSSVN